MRYPARVMDVKARRLSAWLALGALVACAFPLFAQEDAAAPDSPAIGGANPPTPFPGLDSVSPAVLMRRAPATLTLRTVTLDDGAAFTGTVPVSGLWRRDLFDPKTRVPVLEAAFENGEAVLEGVMALDATPTVNRETLPARILPGWLSILPPLLAIALAMATRQVLLALLSGIYAGALFVAGFDPLTAFLRLVDTHLVGSLADSDHAHMILFTFAMGGMVAIVGRSGGTQGIVAALARHARSARSTQIATWAMGIAVFFDDYANCLIVGNTMRPFTDKLRVSREKLAYIVDSTAAPIAGIAVVSLWVGVELGFIAGYKDLIDASMGAAGLAAPDAYGIFIASIPYAFYCLLTLAFVFLVAATGRDFGPMLAAERRARKTGEVLRAGATALAGNDIAELRAPEGKPCRWWNAVLPVGGLVGVMLAGLYFTGRAALGDDAAGAGLVEIAGAANSFQVIAWAAVASCVIAVALAVSQKILTLEEAIGAWLSGVKAMVLAVLVLVLAWALGAVCKDYVFTGAYVVEVFRDVLAPSLLPALVFLLAAAVAFATGTSWGTMGILFPIAIPMACAFVGSGAAEASTAPGILYGTVAAVLSGAIFGDHCSPISDTTILSSMASSCDHIDHVRTQLPYGLAAAGVAVVFGYLPAGFGFSPWWGLLLGAGALAGLLFALGKRIET